MAEGLLKSAKRRARFEAKKGEPQSTVDFCVVTNELQASPRPEGLRRRFLLREDGAGAQKLLLTERPMTVEELEGFVEAVRKAKEKGHIVNLRMAEESFLAASNFYLYQLARTEEMEALHERLFPKGEQRPPWRRRVEGDFLSLIHI